MPATAPLTLALNDGATIPQLGFGTCRIAPENTARSVEQALAAGYRLGGDPAEGDLGAPAYSDCRSWRG